MKLFKYFFVIYLFLCFNKQFCMDMENVNCRMQCDLKKFRIHDTFIYDLDYALKIKLILEFYDKITNQKLDYNEEFLNMICYLSSKRKKIYIQHHQLLHGDITKYTIEVLNLIYKNFGYEKLSWLISSDNLEERFFMLSTGAAQRQNFGRQIEMEFDLTNATLENETIDSKEAIKSLLIKVLTGEQIKKCK